MRVWGGTGGKHKGAGALESLEVWTVALTGAPTPAPPLLGSESPAEEFPSLVSESPAVE